MNPETEKKVIVSSMKVFTSIASDLIDIINGYGGSMEDLYKLSRPDGREKLERIGKIIANGAFGSNCLDDGGIARLLVTSNGTTGRDWIERSERRCFDVNEWTRSILLSPDFKPTSGITTEIVILKGSLFKDKERTTKHVREEAERRGLVKLNAEDACLMRDKLTNEDLEAMNIWKIIAMHNPIMDSKGDLTLLGLAQDSNSPQAYPGKQNDGWSAGVGFAFASVEVSEELAKQG